MQRRTLIGLAAACLTSATLPRAAAHPTWQGLQQARRHLRPRSHVQSRVVDGRIQWIVPARLTVGWELRHEERLVRVSAIWRLEHGSAPREMARVVDATGLASDVEIVREPTT